MKKLCCDSIFEALSIPKLASSGTTCEFYIEDIRLFSDITHVGMASPDAADSTCTLKYMYIPQKSAFDVYLLRLFNLFCDLRAPEKLPKGPKEKSFPCHRVL